MQLTLLILRQEQDLGYARIQNEVVRIRCRWRVTQAMLQWEASHQTVIQLG